MRQSNKTIKAFGIEYQKVSRKDRDKYMAKAVRLRPDLGRPDDYTEFYELDDGSILEIFVYDLPKESILTLYNNENDYHTKILNLKNSLKKYEKYNGKTTYQIISIRVSEIHFIEKNHLEILSDSLKINVNNLNYSKESLKLLDKPFMRITNSEEYDDNLVYKSLLYYLAVMLNSNLTGSEIKFDMQDDIVQQIRLIDSEKKSYNADLGIFEIWTEGPVFTMEFNEAGKKKKGKLTLEILFDVEIGKYKHTFQSKPSNILKH